MRANPACRVLCIAISLHWGLMTETNESQEHQNEEAPVPVMTTVERAEMLLRQDAAIRAKINDGATLDEAVDPSNKEFGSLAHPEQVQMRVAKRAMMLKEGIAPYPVTLDVTDTIEAVRAKYDGKLEAGDETEDVVGIAGRVLFLRNAGGLCFVQLSAGDVDELVAVVYAEYQHRLALANAVDFDDLIMRTVECSKPARR